MFEVDYSSKVEGDETRTRFDVRVSHRAFSAIVVLVAVLMVVGWLLLMPGVL